MYLPMFVSSLVKANAIVDRKATTAKHLLIAQDLEVHAISSASTVAALWKVVKKGWPLSSIVDPSTYFATVYEQATTFICERAMVFIS